MPATVAAPPPQTYEASGFDSSPILAKTHRILSGMGDEEGKGREGRRGWGCMDGEEVVGPGRSDCGGGRGEGRDHEGLEEWCSEERLSISRTTRTEAFPLLRRSWDIVDLSVEILVSLPIPIPIPITFRLVLLWPSPRRSLPTQPAPRAKIVTLTLNADTYMEAFPT